MLPAAPLRGDQQSPDVVTTTDAKFQVCHPVPFVHSAALLDAEANDGLLSVAISPPASSWVAAP